MTKRPGPARDDAGIRLRTARLRRGLTQTTLARHDHRAAGDWLRRLARDPTVSPWLLPGQLAATPPGPPPAIGHP